MPEVRDPRLERFAALFNDGAYWEAHEALEPLWLETPPPRRELYRGLIQAAAAMVHWQNGNRHGMTVLAAKARDKLRQFQPIEDGLQIWGLLFALERCIEWNGPRPMVQSAAWYQQREGARRALPGLPPQPRPGLDRRADDRPSSGGRTRASVPIRGDTPVERLQAYFRRSGCIRWRQPRRADAGGVPDHKGYEIRITVYDLTELQELQELLTSLGIRFGRHFAKHSALVLPIYGKAVVSDLMARLGVSPRDSTESHGPDDLPSEPSDPPAD